MGNGLKLRKDIEVKYKWDTEKMYLDTQSWNKEFEYVKIESVKLKDFEGKLDKKENILNYLLAYEGLSRKVKKLYVYANMRSHEDTSNTEFQGLSSRIESFYAQFASYVSFFEPEILAKDERKFMSMIRNTKSLKIYEFLFLDIFKEKPHVLTKEIEEILASVSDCLSAPENIYGILTNADIDFDSIEDKDGNLIELTEGSYGNYIRSRDRVLREKAFKSLFKTYRKYENTISTSLTSSLKAYIFSAKTRKYKNSLDAALSPSNIPLEVYYNSVKTINNNLDLLHRYVGLKKKLLGLSEMHMYDLYVPVVDIEREKIQYEDALEIVKEGIKPLGDEYISIFNEGVEKRWIDVYENKGKRSGAYSSGMYDTMPYVLLNYNHDLNDVSTLAHEMGHSIHSYYSRKTQPYMYASYTIFSAEIASTTNEILLINDLINKETDKSKKLYLVNQELEQIRTTVYRQLMFAEFELLTHEAIENGEALTAKEYNDMWIELNQRYFGPEMIVDKDIEVEWARIPHFYSDFYVYQYATGYAAASAFAKSILLGKENAIDDYKGFLKAGGSKYPIDAIKEAGVDMTSSKPLEDTLDRFKELLDILEKLI
ncbi:oligoendopeptidase F [uncultured Clostridium sp.]|uniref:oligoendopeptidase F n=1 Tax=uncultured Clostridium sp. TaxID=59620 RepID=UPI002632EF57|nr:oligoendopeptidase F [uncultured Clostridium sp.]